jgi:hypothetical protein
MPKQNDGAPGINGLSFESIEESGREEFLNRFRMTSYSEDTGPCECGRRKYRRTGTKFAFFRYPPS